MVWNLLIHKTIRTADYSWLFFFNPLWPKTETFFKKNLQDVLFGMESYLKLTICSANGWQIHVIRISLISSCSSKGFVAMRTTRKIAQIGRENFPLVCNAELHAEIGLFVTKIWGKRMGKRYLYQEPFCCAIGPRFPYIVTKMKKNINHTVKHCSFRDHLTCKS